MTSKGGFKLICPRCRRTAESVGDGEEIRVGDQ